MLFRSISIAVNRCYGGFSLSPRALKAFAELKGKRCYLFSHTFLASKRVYTPLIDLDNPPLFWSAFTIDNPNEIDDDDWGSVHLSCRPENRADPDLIKVIKELGEKANGQCAKLEIVKIPADVDWEIDEYDGMETVREKSRSW